MKKIDIFNIAISYILGCIKILAICILLVMCLSGCSVPSSDQIDSVTSELREISEDLEGAVGDITEAAETIVDGNSVESALSEMVEKNGYNQLDDFFEGKSEDEGKIEPKVDEYSFAYSKLSKNEKMLYDEIYEILINMQGETSISSVSESEIDVAFKAVLADHPEIFWVDGYNYTKYTTMDKIKNISMCGQYNCTTEERIDYETQIENRVSSITADIDEQASDYEKVKAVYEYIISNNEYDISSEYNQDIRSVLLNGKSVCQGYAKATQLLLNRLGVPTTLVTGKVQGEGHAWNMVMVDDEYYFLDTTWGDASYADETGKEFDGRIPDINYEYFLVTTEDIKGTHKIGDKWDYPKCTSNISNYYIKEGLYFTSVDNTQLENVFDRAIDKKQEYVSLKCADRDCYDKMTEYLIDEQKVFEYLNDIDTLKFAMSDDSLTIILWLR